MSYFAAETETDAAYATKGLVASEVPNEVNQILSNVVIDLFSVAHPDENELQTRLIRPLEALWGAKEVYRVLQSTPTVANFCGKVFKNGEPAIFCKDCQTDPTCCLCLECFEHSQHKNHNYKLFASGGGGCCDCGDPEAWNDHVYCSNHKPQEKETGQQVDPVANLPGQLVECVQSFLSTVLWYCMNVLNWGESRSVPPEVNSPQTKTLLEKDEFIAYLNNDEVHTYDEVITGLSRYCGMTHSDATDLATVVDRKGRAILMKGPEQKCLTAQTNVNKGLRQSPLRVTICHVALVRHQKCAVFLLNFLKELADKSEGFCRLIAMVCIQPSLTYNNQCLLDRFFLNDNSLWIEARLCWNRLVMSSIYKDFEYKKELAISLARNYRKLAKNFLADSHDHDICAMNLTVQLFTVPSISRMLVNEHNVLEHVMTTIGDMVAPLYNGDKECLNLHSRGYKHERMAYLLYDMRYIIRNRPEQWTDHLRLKTRDAGTVFLNLLSSMENMDAVKRQSGVHVEHEPSWENSFNFSILMLQPLKLFIEWCASDQKVLLDIVGIALRRIRDMYSKLVYKPHSVDASVVGKRSLQLITFDIFKDKVSFHHPLARFVAGLIACSASRYNLSITDILQTDSSQVHHLSLLLLEMSSRAVVLSSQVLGGMWKRNGYGVLNQALHYQLHLSRTIMYDQDIVMLQSMAAIMDPDTFVYAMLYKYRLENWFTSSSNGGQEWVMRGEDSQKFLTTEIEELLFTLIVIFGERYQSGIGEGMSPLDSVRRELIHILYLGPLPHSQITKRFKILEDDNTVNRLIKEVATLKKISGKGVFELKEEHHESYDPFYYHYSKVEQSKAEEVWRNHFKKGDRPQCAPPCLPPPFTEPYRGILRLSESNVLLKMLHNIFSEASKDDAKIWSIKLLHQALHLSALILAEEYRLEINSFARKCLGMDEGWSLLPLLKRLQQSKKIEERQLLLTWVIQQLQKVGRDIGGYSDSHMEVTPSATVDIVEETDSDTTPSKRRLLIEEQRKRMMSHIANLQQKFFEEHKQELDLIKEPTDVERQSSVASHVGSALVCGVGVSATQSHDHHGTVTCILCQESGDVSSTTGEKSFIVSVCVQRSAVMRRTGQPCNDGDIDFLSGRLNQKWGVFTGGCGHIMHASCWKKYIEDKQTEQRRRLFMQTYAIHWEDGEYICPLCRTFSNTVLPLALCPSRGRAYLPSKSLSLNQTRSLIDYVVKLGNIETAVSAMDDFNKVLNELFSVSQGSFKMIEVIKQSDSPRSLMEYVFGQRTFMQAYAQPPDYDSRKTPIAIWNNCIYTISALEHSLRQNGKFLLDSLSSRQMDIVHSLVELSTIACNNTNTTVLSELANDLILNLLPQCSAFSDHPSVLDMDIFTIVGNLRIILSALLQRVDSSISTSDNLYYPALMGVVDTCIVSVATSVVMMQYLLSVSPANDNDMEVENDDKPPELEEGLRLQKLWLNLRKYALTTLGLDSTHSDTPPSPYSLLIGIQEHLYPFFQKLSLLYYCISGIKLVHTSASEASNFTDLCTYLGLPHSLPSLFDDLYIQNVAKNMCSHPKISNMIKTPLPTNDLLLFKPIRSLITLPNSYSDLVSQASHFKCPRSNELGGDDSRVAMLCLVCGEMICAHCQCCSKNTDDDESVKVGGLTYHSLSCGSGFGMALWIVEAYVVLLNATDIHKVKGCTITPPYVDEYEEQDPGLRRGNPLHFTADAYKTLQDYWWDHQIPEQICKQTEHNLRLIQINWSSM